VSVKLATLVIVAVRGFQAAPPLAYSIADEDEARPSLRAGDDGLRDRHRARGRRADLLGRWVVRLLTADSFYAAYKALPWVALGWALYGSSSSSSPSRASEGHHPTFPAAVVGLAVNVAGLALLVGPLGLGAGIALCAAYLAMLVVHLLTRGCSPCRSTGRAWPVASRDRGGVSVAGELLPTSGADGFAAPLALAAILCARA
jgi:hypothetical protein